MLRSWQIVWFGTALILTCLIVAAARDDPKKPAEIWIGDVLDSDESIRYGKYFVEKRTRKVRCEWPTQEPCSIDVSYAVLKRNRRVWARLDGDIYFGPGNDVRFGLVSLLGGRTNQVVITQDIFRGGAQWIVNLGSKPRMIFNGMDWSVGREGDDMTIVDLDSDGVYEVLLPITDFYSLQDKMSISQIPLPEIVFRYDRKHQRYFPANRRFRDYLLRQTRKLDSRSENEFAFSSAILDIVLTRIYAGRERDAWHFYHRTYNLRDKAEIRRRVRSILRKQPVYNFIYPRSRRK